MTFREETAPGRLLLRVLPEESPAPFEPGQSVSLGLFAREPRLGGGPPDPAELPPDRLVRRPYTMTSRPGEKEREFYLSLVPDGMLTPRLFALRAGDPLWIASRPRGGFPLSRIPQDRDLLFLAVGTGVAPFVSMIRSRGAAGRRRWALLHGARRPGELGFREELESAAGERFLYLPSVTRPGPEDRWEGPVGRLNAFLGDGSAARVLGGPVEPGRWRLFLCGPPEMVHDLRERFLAEGFTPAGGEEGEAGDLHVDSY